MRRIKRILPHITIVLSLMTLTFFGIDRVNRSMAFMTSELSKWVFLLLGVSALLSAILLVAAQWREDDRQRRKLFRAQARTALQREQQSDDGESAESEE